MKGEGEANMGMDFFGGLDPWVWFGLFCSVLFCLFVSLSLSLCPSFLGIFHHHLLGQHLDNYYAFSIVHPTKLMGAAISSSQKNTKNKIWCAISIV